MILLALIFGFFLFTSTASSFGEQSVPMVQQEDAPSVDEILNRMKAHDEWQRLYLIEYRAERKFHAANLRFKEDATLEVRTTFRRPDTLESEVLRAEGSKIIRERVFNKILEAENDTKSKLTKQQIDVGPGNYRFSYLGREDCDGRECYRLGLTPKRKEKYLIEGQIWTMAKTGALYGFKARLQNAPRSGRGILRSIADTSASVGCG